MKKLERKVAFISKEFIDEFIDLLENDDSCYEYVDSNLKTKIRNNTNENDEELDSLSPLQLKNINDSLSPTNKSVPKQESTSTKSDIENQIT